MSLTLSLEIGSAKSSPSLRYFPFENLVTNISILFHLLNLYLPFSGNRRRCTGRVRVRYNGNEVCGSQRDKNKIVALQARKLPHRQQKSRAWKTNLTRLCRLSIGVLSDDFAAVDVREELCKTKPPEKANSEGLLQSDNHSEEIAGKK